MPLKFFVLRFAPRVFVARYQNTRHATPNMTRDRPKVFGINVKLVSMCFVRPSPRPLEKLQSHENRDTTTAKWARRADIARRPAARARSLVSQRTYLARRAILGRVLCDLFPRRAEITRARGKSRGKGRRRGREETHGVRRGCFDGRGLR